MKYRLHFAGQRSRGRLLVVGGDGGAGTSSRRYCTVHNYNQINDFSIGYYCWLFGYIVDSIRSTNYNLFSIIEHFFDRYLLPRANAHQTKSIYLLISTAIPNGEMSLLFTNHNKNNKMLRNGFVCVFFCGGKATAIVCIFTFCFDAFLYLLFLFLDVCTLDCLFGWKKLSTIAACVVLVVCKYDRAGHKCV